VYGLEVIKITLVLILCILAIVDDAKSCKIYNFHTAFFTISGIILNFIFYKFNGFVQALLGWLFPVSCLFVLYALRMLGAGDIKLIGAIGAIMGPSFAFYVMVYSFFTGALIAMVIVIASKDFRTRIKYFITYLKNCFLTMKISTYGELSHEKGKGCFRFAYAVLPAVLIRVVL